MKKAMHLFTGTALAIAALALVFVAAPAPAAGAEPTCGTYSLTGYCCCGTLRCTDQSSRTCTAQSGATYEEYKCTFWSTCS